MADVLVANKTEASQTDAMRRTEAEQDCFSFANETFVRPLWQSEACTPHFDSHKEMKG